jgi:hypothetical protein
MQAINIERRFEERLEVIRRQAEFLPAGKRNLVLNSCAKLSAIAKKAGKQLTTAHHRGPVHQPWDAREQEDFANLANQKKRIWAALLEGRVLSLENAAEFGTSQMHTHFYYIRREIDAKHLPYTLCDEWYHPGEGRSRFKKYWLVHDLEKEVQNG